MPVAIAPIDRKMRTMLLKLTFERLDQLSIRLVDRTHTIEQFVVLGHVEHSLARHIASTQNILKEGKHVIPAFRSAKRDNQNCVVHKSRTDFSLFKSFHLS